ncbi:hypothetical protein B0H16DRAFT_1452135 [Mycena metata]|uniref:Uncharacterized protein n=1 Tax=Mycena metata TaxID=1033252 RepID=A0AAD7JS62_9AGAR|nr:hypothetical protein B0H16DRAFT_1452135 [Mycena metata]
MHSAITDILRELPFYGVDLPLPCPIPAYWMRHPDHLDFMRHPDQFGNGYASDGDFIGEATESWRSWALRELPFYGVDLPLFAYELHRTGPGEHDFDFSIEGTFKVRRKNCGVLYDVLASSSGKRVNLQLRGVLHTFQQEMKKQAASKFFAESELPFWDAGGVESPFWEMQRKLLSLKGERHRGYPGCQKWLWMHPAEP